jgi:hypothetical protein
VNYINPFKYIYIYTITIFFENNCGAKPPSNEYINQKGEQQLTKKPQGGRKGGRRRPTSS